jgi:hypothetical protein
MDDQALRFTPTHGSEEHPGTVLGVDIQLFWWVGLALLAGLAVLLALSPQTGFFAAAPWAAAPVTLVLLFLRSQRGKPPGHVLDLIDQVFTGGDAWPPLTPLASDHDDFAT